MLPTFIKTRQLPTWRKKTFEDSLNQKLLIFGQILRSSRRFNRGPVFNHNVHINSDDGSLSKQTVNNIAKTFRIFTRKRYHTVTCHNKVRKVSDDGGISTSDGKAIVRMNGRRGSVNSCGHVLDEPPSCQQSIRTTRRSAMIACQKTR